MKAPFSLLAAALVLALPQHALALEPAPAPPEEKTSEVSPYAHQSSKGRTYYLFSREQKLKNSDKTITMYYFAKDPKNKKGTPMAKVPEDRVVSETMTGLLVLKKKAKKEEAKKKEE